VHLFGILEEAIAKLKGEISPGARQIVKARDTSKGRDCDEIRSAFINERGGYYGSKAWQEVQSVKKRVRSEQPDP